MFSKNISSRLMLPLMFALNVPRHPLNLLLRTTWTPELCPKLCRTLPPWSKCLLLAWPLSCRLCDFLNIAVANGDSKVMSFAFLRTSSLLYQFCLVSLLMYLCYVATSPLTNREFRVRCQRVHDAPLWLMEHTRYYGDISVSVENPEQLPDDGPLQLRLDQYVTEPRRAHW